MSTIIRPKWQHDVNQYLNVERIICLMGNVYDKSISLDDERGYCTVPEYLRDLLIKKGYSEENIKYFDPIAGNVNSTNDLTGIGRKNKERPIETLADTIAKDFTKRDAPPTVYIIPNASFFNVDNANISPEENDAWVKLRVAGQQNTNDSKIIFLFSSFADVPTSLTKGQYFIKTIDVSMPDQTQRRQFTSAIFSNFSIEDCTAVSDASDKLTLDRMEAIFKNLCRKVANPTSQQVVKKIESYFFGYNDNPWFNVPKEKLNGLEDYLNEYIKGQKEAIHQIVETIKSVCNGTADKLKNSKYAPKAVLFFPGTTGVGKTEICKKIAEYILGDESNMITINCNEYKESHNPQRLIGAPPGYVGYDQGGQLTNAVREHPFSIVLFDEIEKANGVIWDYLMTVLSDGRLTDGRGQLCNFSNTLIVFTTNLGSAEASECNNNEDAKQVMRTVIEKYYKNINRREVYGRIKRGIIPFSSITEGTAVEIIKLQLDKYIKRYAEEGTKVVFSDDVIRWVTSLCANSNEYGGRDVAGAVQDCLVKGLSDIADTNNIKGATVYIDSLKYTENEDVLFNYRVVGGYAAESEVTEVIDRIVDSPATDVNAPNTPPVYIRKSVINANNNDASNGSVFGNSGIVIGRRRRA